MSSTQRSTSRRHKLISIWKRRRRAAAVATGGACGLGLAVFGGLSIAAAAIPTRAGGRDAARPAQHGGFLAGLDRITTLASTVPANGDVNPYAIIVAPLSAGRLVKGHVLVANFNDKANQQGTGSTIVQVSPSGQVKLFAQIPRHLKGCPGGIGISTAITVLHTGWVIVGSTPSANGNSATAGAGCLVLLNPDGQVRGTIHGPNLDGPWDMASIVHDKTATLFVDNTLFGVGAPGQAIIHKGTIVRIDLAVPTSGTPTVTSEKVIGTGFAEQASSEAFVIGPTGLAVESDGTLYVADRVENRVTAIPDAIRRSESDGTGTTLTSGGALAGPLGMTTAPNGDLLVVNAENGKAVEISTTGTQVASKWLDRDKAQSPPGSGDLFGLTDAPDGRGLYFVTDDHNTLDLLR